MLKNRRRRASWVSTWSVFPSMLAIFQWWGFNVTVIITNKWIFRDLGCGVVMFNIILRPYSWGDVYQSFLFSRQKLKFHYPLSVSCVHFISSAIRAYLVIEVLKFKPLIVVEPGDRCWRIFPMSSIFCVNIVLGNVGLRYIPVSFMQIIKSFTLPQQWLIWRKHFDWRIWVSLIPIVGGILLTSMTSSVLTCWILCCFIWLSCYFYQNRSCRSLLHGYNFDSINMVYYLAPFATMILALPALVLEGSGIVGWFHTCPSLFSFLFIIFGSGVLAFCLNFSLFYVIQNATEIS